MARLFTVAGEMATLVSRTGLAAENPPPSGPKPPSGPAHVVCGPWGRAGALFAWPLAPFLPTAVSRQAFSSRMTTSRVTIGADVRSDRMSSRSGRITTAQPVVRGNGRR